MDILTKLYKQNIRKMKKLTFAMMLAAVSLSAQASLGDPIVSPAPGFIPSRELRQINVMWGIESNPIQIKKISDDLNATAHIIYDQEQIDSSTGEPYTERDATIPGSIINGDFTGNEQGFGFILQYITTSKETLDRGWKTGKYTVTIPAGIIEDEEGNTNDELVLVYNVLDELDPDLYSITPETTTGYADEATMVSPSQLSSVTFNFGGLIQPSKLLSDWGDEMVVTVAHIDGNNMLIDATYTYDELQITDDGCGFVMDLSSVVQNGYYYLINVPYHFLIINANGTYYYSADYSPIYFIWNGLSDAEILEAPKEYEEMLSIPPIKLTWNLPVKESEKGFSGILYNCYNYHYADDSDIVCVLPQECFNLTDEILTIDIPQSLYEGVTGYINLVINEGIVTYEGKSNPEQLIAVFKLSEMYPFEAVVDGPDSEGVISVIWPGLTDIAYVSNNQNFQPYLITPFGSKEYLEFGDQISYIQKWNEGWGGQDIIGLSIEINGLAEMNGQYKLVIPAGYAALTDIDWIYFNALNQEVVYSFSYENGIWTGIESPTTNQQSQIQIFNLQGRKFDRLTDINRLPAGIYIINGKKVMIEN